jgi:hypothetical protein
MFSGPSSATRKSGDMSSSSLKLVAFIVLAFIVLATGFGAIGGTGGF